MALAPTVFVVAFAKMEFLNYYRIFVCLSRGNFYNFKSLMLRDGSQPSAFAKQS